MTTLSDWEYRMSICANCSEFEEDEDNPRVCKWKNCCSKMELDED